MSVISVLAGGWSASQVSLRHLPGTIIAVNDSALYAPRWDIAISMDRLWTEHRWEWIGRQSKPIYIRRCALKNCCDEEEPHVIPFECDYKSTQLIDNEGKLNGTHSGFCALNLAYKMRPKEIYLFGFDMQRGPKGEAHWFPQYPWVNGHATSTGKLASWATQFDGAAKQLRQAGIRAYICNGAGSAIRSFRRTELSCLVA